MYLTLIRHRWKRLIRSRVAARSLARLFLVTVVGLSIGFYLVLGAWILPGALRDIRPETDPLLLVNRYLLAALIVWTVVRFFSQRSFADLIRPYLHLPIRRANLFRWVRWEAGLSWLNVLPLLFLGALGLRMWSEGYAAGSLIPWWIAVSCGVLVSHYGATLLRMVLGWYAVIGIAVVTAGMVAAALYLPLASEPLAAASVWLFHPGGYSHWIAILVLLAGVAVADYATGRILHRGVDLRDEHRSAPVRMWRGFSLGRSLAARLVQQEFKLLMRNKRPRQILLGVVPFVAFVMLHVYSIRDDVPGSAIILVALVLMMMSTNYGQFAFSWSGRYFDRLLAWPIPPSALIRSRLRVIQALMTVPFLLFLPMLFLMNATTLLAAVVALYFYCIGNVVWINLYIAFMNRTRVALNDSSFFNYQGFTLTQFLIPIVALLPPILLFALVDFSYAAALLAISGVAGILLTNPLTSRMTRRWRASHRYAMASGFRDPA